MILRWWWWCVLRCSSVLYLNYCSLLILSSARCFSLQALHSGDFYTPFSYKQYKLLYVKIPGDHNQPSGTNKHATMPWPAPACFLTLCCSQMIGWLNNCMNLQVFLLKMDGECMFYALWLYRRRVTGWAPTTSEKVQKPTTSAGPMSLTFVWHTDLRRCVKSWIWSPRQWGVRS